jgi:membrane fusion protein (multidrug efflux system)
MTPGTQDRSRRLSAATRITLLAAGPLVLVGAGAVYLSISAQSVSTDNAYLKANRVKISADVAGRVIAVAVDDNDVVKRGDVLFRLDDQPFAIDVARAEAELQREVTEVKARKARYASSEATLAAANSGFEFAEREYERRVRLSERKVMSAAQLDAAWQERERTRQEVARISEERHALLAELGGDASAPANAHASYLVAKAELDRARLDLARTVVRAPADGIVAQSTQFRPGDYVQAGMPMFVLVENSVLWVEANLKETQLGKVRVGQPAQVRVTAYPDHVWKARVESVSAGTGAEFSLLPPQNATGNWVKVTQRVPVRLALERRFDDPPLRLGMSAEVEIDILAKPKGGGRQNWSTDPVARTAPDRSGE